MLQNWQFGLKVTESLFLMLICELPIHLNRRDSRSTICHVHRRRVLPSRDQGTSQGRYASVRCPINISCNSWTSAMLSAAMLFSAIGSAGRSKSSGRPYSPTGAYPQRSVTRNGTVARRGTVPSGAPIWHPVTAYSLCWAFPLRSAGAKERPSKGFGRSQGNTRQFTERRHNIHRLCDEIEALSARHIPTGNQEHLMVDFRVCGPIAFIFWIDVGFPCSLVFADRHTVVGHHNDERIVP